MALWGGGDRPRQSTAEAIKREIAAIEGRELPPKPAQGQTRSESEGGDTAVRAVMRPDAMGALASEISAIMDGPPSSPASSGAPEPSSADVSECVHRRPPGGGTGMVDNTAAGPLFALCLSGGGIRSAAFCLGGTQALAHVGLLSRFHYLSTVSGGGYTGSLIARLINTAGGVEPAEALLASPDSDESVPWLSSLRSYTSFLAPRLGATSLDVWAAFALYMRNTMANWVLFLPGLVALALIPRLYLRLVEDAEPAWQTPLAIVAGLCLAVAVINASLLVPGHQPPSDRPKVTAARIAQWISLPLILGWAFLATMWLAPSLPDAHAGSLPLIAGAISIAAYVAAWIFAVIAGANPRNAPLFAYNFPGWVLATVLGNLVLLAGVYLANQLPLDRVVLAILGPAWIILSHLVHAGIFGVLRREARSSWMDREWIARLSASELLSGILWLGLATTCLALPHCVDWLLDGNASKAALPAILTGPLAALLGRSGLTASASALPKATLMHLLPTALAVVASLVFLVTLLMLASVVGWRAAAWVNVHWLTTDCTGTLVWREPTHCAPGFWTLLLEAVVLAITSWVLGRWIININRFSLHELYRNRLVRAFLGPARPWRVRKGEEDGFTRFDEADALRLSDAIPWFPTAAAPEGLRLFPVINTALNLVSGTRTAWTERKAASFTMTPLHCGSAVLGTDVNGVTDGAFVKTSIYGGAPLVCPATLNAGMQLGTAMTISGAAVSPNAGYHSSATTSFIMALFNARLGAWLPNPAVATDKQLERSRPPNGFWALVAEMLGRTNGTSPAIYLSDGGHFDNLGIYEMLRRRCRLIVAFDAGCDPDHAYYDLGDALRKARIDLGVEVSFPTAAGPSPGVPPQPRFFRADVRYPAGPATPAGSGVLLYVKSHMPTSAPADVLAYQAGHKVFPNESTGNQFFTESQFESYRRLGEYLAS